MAQQHKWLKAFNSCVEKRKKTWYHQG